MATHLGHLFYFSFFSLTLSLFLFRYISMFTFSPNFQCWNSSFAFLERFNYIWHFLEIVCVFFSSSLDSLVTDFHFIYFFYYLFDMFSFEFVAQHISSNFFWYNMTMKAPFTSFYTIFMIRRCSSLLKSLLCRFTKCANALRLFYFLSRSQSFYSLNTRTKMFQKI